MLSNVLATGLGIMLIVVMLSLALGIRLYSRDMLRDSGSALAIEVCQDPRSPKSKPISREKLGRFKMIPGVAGAEPIIQGIFVELTASQSRKATVSLVSTQGGEDPEIKRLTMKFGDVRQMTGKDDYLLVPVDVLKEMNVDDPSSLIGQKLELVCKKRNGRAELEKRYPVKLVAVAAETRFYRCYAPLGLLEKIWEWQRLDGKETPDSATGKGDNLADRRYESAVVHARELDDVKEIRKRIEADNYRTVSILDTVTYYSEISTIISVILGTLGGISLFTGSISIFNASFASVLRRMREFGIYKSCGASRFDLIAIVEAEAVITALVAGLLGYAGGVALSYGIQRTFLASLGKTLFVHEWWFVLFAVAVAVFACTLACLGPALKAARLSPVEALRYE